MPAAITSYPRDLIGYGPNPPKAETFLRGIIGDHAATRHLLTNVNDLRTVLVTPEARKLAPAAG
jgi:hypothetical protein